jgi:cytochrome c-type biogenesis protein CcmH
MLVWVTFAVMTVLGVLAVLVPLSRSRGSGPNAAHDVQVYRDQLDEVERDRASGLIPAREADAARTEIARRLLKAAREVDAASPNAPGRSYGRLTAMACVVLIPVVSLSIYQRIGSPALPDMPLSARLQSPPEGQSIDQLLVRIEQHLARNPEDGKGWDVLAPVYARLGRYPDAETAFRNAIRLLGPSLDRLSALGEMIVLQNGGIVVADARTTFEAALAVDPKAILPRMFMALALSQDGKLDAAEAAWTQLISEGKADDPWIGDAREELAKVQAAKAGTAPPVSGPTPDQVAAAQAMSAGERSQMIEQMVERLATRLNEQGGPVDEWVRLVRALATLGKTEDARTALASARRAHGQNTDANAKLEAIAKQFSL